MYLNSFLCCYYFYYYYYYYYLLCAEIPIKKRKKICVCVKLTCLTMLNYYNTFFFIYFFSQNKVKLKKKQQQHTHTETVNNNTIFMVFKLIFFIFPTI
jgi:hypothetical protein